jgi:hypothetical protein
MTLLEAILGMTASVFAIVGGLYMMLRWLDKRFDKWTEAIVENSQAMRNLGLRVTRLERAFKIKDDNDTNNV